MVMYSTEGKYPVISMPGRVRRTNGLTYTAEAVLENLSDPTHPYIEVVDPPSYDKETHNLEWTGTDWLITEKPPAPESLNLQPLQSLNLQPLQSLNLQKQQLRQKVANPLRLIGNDLWISHL